MNGEATVVHWIGVWLYSAQWLGMYGVDMAAAKAKKEELVAGDSLTVELLVQDGAKAPVDLSSCLVEWLLLEASDEPVLQKSSIVDGEILIDPDQVTDGKGKCKWIMTSQETSNLVPGTYRHIARVRDLEGNERVVLKGEIAIAPLWG
jgi:hypothetical protein